MSARLPLFTLVMKAQRRPDSVILPPTTWGTGGQGHEDAPAAAGGTTPGGWATFSPSSAPASAGTVPSFILLFRRIRPIRRSPSLDGCQVTGCWGERTRLERRRSDAQNLDWFGSVPWRRARPRRARSRGPTTGCPCLLATEISRQQRPTRPCSSRGQRPDWTRPPPGLEDDLTRQERPEPSGQLQGWFSDSPGSNRVGALTRLGFRGSTGGF